MVTKDALAKFKQDGFVHFKGFFSEELCREARLETQNYLKGFISDSSERNKSDFEVINQEQKVKYCQSVFDTISSLRKLLTSELANAAAELLEVKSVFLSGVEIHARNSGGSEIPLHQDNVSFCLKRAKGLTAYIVLDSQNGANGGLGYLPTNLGGEMIDHSITNIPGFSASINEKGIEKDNFVYPDYSIGDITFHHCQTPHRANPRPIGLNDSFAVSPRFFSTDDQIDLERFEKYQAKLYKHRNR